MEWILLFVGLAVGYAIGHARRRLTAQKRVSELNRTLVHMLERGHGASPARARQVARPTDPTPEAPAGPLSRPEAGFDSPADDEGREPAGIRHPAVSREPQPELDIHPREPQPLPVDARDGAHAAEPVTAGGTVVPGETVRSSTEPANKRPPEVDGELKDGPPQDTLEPNPDPPSEQSGDVAEYDAAAPPTWATAVDPWTGTEFASDAVVDGSADGDEGVHVVLARAAVTTAKPLLGASTDDTEPDDLTRIKGIGPKITAFLNDSGMTSFSDLAATDPAALRELLAGAGQGFALADPRSWPLQAALAAERRWLALRAVQAAGAELSQDQVTSTTPAPDHLTDADEEAAPSDAG